MPGRIEQTIFRPGIVRYQAPKTWKMEDGGYVLPLQSTETIVTLRGSR
jgi:hypothetical protein